MKLKYRLISTFLGVCLSLPTHVFAHSGGTNSDGCHNDNINGGYHCHNSKSSSSSGGGEILLAALIVGTAYWYLTTLEPSSNNNYKLDEPNKLKSKFKFSFKPTSMTEMDGVSLQMSYAF